MTDSESPGTLFELLYCFLKDLVGRTRKIVYDNGCHLVDYMINRDPAWSKKQRVFIDQLHAANHTSCSPLLSTGVVSSHAKLYMLHNACYAHRKPCCMSGVFCDHFVAPHCVPRLWSKVCG